MEAVIWYCWEYNKEVAEKNEKIASICMTFEYYPQRHCYPIHHQKIFLPQASERLHDSMMFISVLAGVTIKVNDGVMENLRKAGFQKLAAKYEAKRLCEESTTPTRETAKSRL